MFINTFQGYNCYSSAIGEWSMQKNIDEIQKIILTQWTYFFDKELFRDNQWYTGAARGPVDEFLKEDLQAFANINIEEHITEEVNALNESRAILRNEGYQIILVDFYYLNSFNWKSLSRFHVTREHDPHFILLDNIMETQVHIIDPFYHHEEIMEINNLMKARNSLTKQGKLNFNSYSVVTDGIRKVNVRELLHFRFDRYMKETMYDNIEEFALTVKNLPEGINRKWAFTGYNCLNSIIYLHQNLISLPEINNQVVARELSELVESWALIRKKLFQYYSEGSTATTEISEFLFQIGNAEKKLAQKVLNGL